MLTAISNFWFERTRHIVAESPDAASRCRATCTRCRRAGAARGPRGDRRERLKPLPVEAVVRGYLIGSGWKDYQRERRACAASRCRAGLRRPTQLPRADLHARRPRPPPGQHDENIAFDDQQSIGASAQLAAQVRANAHRALCASPPTTRARAASSSPTPKFEFGLDEPASSSLIDEVLTPDSSRFWPADELPARHEPAAASTSSSCATTSRRSTGTRRAARPAAAARRDLRGTAE